MKVWSVPENRFGSTLEYPLEHDMKGVVFSVFATSHHGLFGCLFSSIYRFTRWCPEKPKSVSNLQVVDIPKNDGISNWRFSGPILSFR